MLFRMNKKQTVFVGLSGGVDSSVAAARLLKEGYNVTGVFIKVWHPDFMVCNWEEERLDAMRVAAHLNVPFLTCDAEVEYRDEVAKYFIEEYKAGRTPNPDVMCNKQVKFGAFMRFAKEKGADFIATGHYAQRINTEIESEMHRGVDTNKDQTYFLWTLTKEQLDYSLFPVGNSPKEEIRKEAEKLGIPTANKKDSQGVCFLGHIDITEFLSHYVNLKEGEVMDESGEPVGVHHGALTYTTGQRHGFSLSTKNANRETMYVVDKDIENNIITVSKNKPETIISDKYEIIHSVLRSNVEDGEILEAQFRYRQKPFSVRIESVTDKTFSLEMLEKTDAPAVGQSCVLYRGSLCVGGGILA